MEERGGSERRKGRSNPVFVVVVDPRVRETTPGGVEERFKFSPLRFRAGCERGLERWLDAMVARGQVP